MTHDPINWPHPLVKEAWETHRIYETGVTEPWVQQAVAALLVASKQHWVLELGCYLGLTTAWLACTLQRMGGGKLIGVELDAERWNHTTALLAKLDTPDVDCTILLADSLAVLRSLGPHSIGFAWVDDDHTAAHVAEELDYLCKPTAAAFRVMKPGGLICMHDVGGPLGLDAVCRRFGGYPLALPRLGPAGGLGIIQLP